MVKEGCCTAMLHGDMTLSRIMVYAQSIEDSKHGRISWYAKWGSTDEHVQHKFKKKDLNQDSSSSPKVNHERDGGSQMVKPTCATCGKKHFGKCLASTSACFCCGKEDHQVRDCPTIAARGREYKQVSDSGALKRNLFYALRAKGTKLHDDDDAGKL